MTLSSTITISGWTSLGAVAALVECRSICGLWLIDAAGATVPAVTFTRSGANNSMDHRRDRGEAVKIRLDVALFLAGLLTGLDEASLIFYYVVVGFPYARIP